MNKFITLIFILVSVFAVAQEKQFTDIAEAVVKSMQKEDLSLFQELYPNEEEVLAFFKKMGQEPGEEQVKQALEQIQQASSMSFEDLLEGSKEAGWNWKKTKVAAIEMTGAVDANTEKVNFVAILIEGEKDVRLRFSDVYQLGPGEWMLTEEIRTSGTTGGEGGGEPVVESEQVPEVSTEQVKAMITMLANNLQPPRKVKDELMEEGTDFIPGDEVDPEARKKLAETFTEKIEFEFSHWGTEYDGKELWLNQLSMKLEWYDFPDFRTTDVFVTINQVIDNEGTNLLTDITPEMEAVIDWPQYFDFIPLTEGFEFLGRDLDIGEEVTIKGTMEFDFPTTYDAISFTANETGVTKNVRYNQVELLEMKDNQVVLKVGGDRRNFEVLSKMYLNSDGKQFNGMSSSQMPAFIYNKWKDNGGQLSEQQIGELADAFDMNAEYDWIVIIEVPGAIDRIVIYRPDGFIQHRVEYERVFKN